MRSKVRANVPILSILLLFITDLQSMGLGCLCCRAVWWVTSCCSAVWSTTKAVNRCQMTNMLFEFIRVPSCHFYRPMTLRFESRQRVPPGAPPSPTLCFPTSTLELLRWSASIWSADTAQRFLGHYGRRAGEVGQEKQVMWDWRLKYFINQCCGQCVVWWLVENSGNPSFQPSTGIQDSPQVHHVMPLFLYFQGWARTLDVFAVSCLFVVRPNL